MNEAPDMARYRPIALVRSWEDFRLAFRARCDELDVARATVDAVGGLPSGQTAKLLAPIRDQGFGPMSLHAMAAALGLAILVVEDTDAIERIRARFSPRNTKMVRHASGRHASGKKRRRTSISKGDTEWSRIMNARRVVAISPSKRKRIARAAALTRWEKARLKMVKDPKLMRPRQI